MHRNLVCGKQDKEMVLRSVDCEAAAQTPTPPRRSKRSCENGIDRFVETERNVDNSLRNIGYWAMMADPMIARIAIPYSTAFAAKLQSVLMNYCSFFC